LSDTGRELGADSGAPPAPRATTAGGSRRYEPPHIVASGSLADLTAGGSVSAEDDGFGSAGASGGI